MATTTLPYLAGLGGLWPRQALAARASTWMCHLDNLILKKVKVAILGTLKTLPARTRES